MNTSIIKIEYETIEKKINKEKYVIIQVSFEQKNTMLFTIGLKKNYNMPELLLFCTDTVCASNVITEIVNFNQLGLSLEESLNCITINDIPLKSALVPENAKKVLTPQLNLFYDRTELNPSSYDLRWIGRNDDIYPFDNYLEFGNTSILKSERLQ